MKSPWFRSGVLGPVVALMWASTAGAQPIASSLEDVKALVSANPNVMVTDTSGQEFRGTITDAAESTLSLRIAGGTRRFQAADVRTIRVRSSDSLVNGADRRGNRRRTDVAGTSSTTSATTILSVTRPWRSTAASAHSPAWELTR